LSGKKKQDCWVIVQFVVVVYFTGDWQVLLGHTSFFEVLEGEGVDGVVITIRIVISPTVLGDGNLEGVTELSTATACGEVNTTLVFVDGDDELLVFATVNNGLNDVIVRLGNLITELLGVLLDSKVSAPQTQFHAQLQSPFRCWYYYETVEAIGSKFFTSGNDGSPLHVWRKAGAYFGSKRHGLNWSFLCVGHGNLNCNCRLRRGRYDTVKDDSNQQ
jgi:hypothetical protein